MRVRLECYACQARVRLRDVLLLFGESRVAWSLYSRVLSELALACRRGEHTVFTATRLFRFIRLASGSSDPYAEVKRGANEALARVAASLMGSVGLEDVIRLSVVGNALDVGVAGYEPPEPSELLAEARAASIVGLDSALKVISGVCRSGGTVLLLLDNAGEAALDLLLAAALHDCGARLVVVAKSGPFQNDVTVGEAVELGFTRYGELIGSGCDCASIFLEYAPPRLRWLLRSADLVVAKGMAHYEYLNYLREGGHELAPTLHLLKAKCRPVAESLGVSVGSYVALVR